MVVRGNESGQAVGTGGSVAPSTSMAPVYETEWYAAPDGQQVGPIPIERVRAMIRTGAITPETVVWNEMLPDWTAAEQVEQLAAMFAPKPKAPPPLPPALFFPYNRPHPKMFSAMVHSVTVGRRLLQKSQRGWYRQLVPGAYTAFEDAHKRAVHSAQSGLSGASIQPVARDTLQYVSPDRSEPGREDVSAVELLTPPATVDLADSQDASSVTDVSESLGQALLSAQPADSIAPEQTELMNVEALVAEAAES